MLFLDYFLLTKGIKYIVPSLTFTFRICNFFWLFLLCKQLFNKLQTTAINNQLTSKPPCPWGPSIIYPQNFKHHTIAQICLQLAKSHPCKITRQIIVSQSAAVDNQKQHQTTHVELKQKHMKIFLYILKKPKLPNYNSITTKFQSLGIKEDLDMF